MEKLKVISFLLLLISLISCGNDDDDSTNNVCEENYVSDAVFSTFSITNGFSAVTTIDLETHEYTIKINADGKLCSIGYKNSPTYTGNYTMQVENLTSGVNYSGLHSFSQTNIEYQAITPAISVTSADIINVKRTIEPGYTLFLDEIGDVITSSNLTMGYPIFGGNIEFLASNFYGTGGPLQDYAIPIICLGFKLN